MSINISPTLMGCVGAVSGASISIRQAASISSGIAIIGGKSYRVGQVGTFVRIPQGYHDLYGIISEVGANATPENIREPQDRGERWMTIQLVGEMVGNSFERGISQYPSINDEVHLVTEEDLARIYGDEGTGQITIGRLANAEGIPVRIDLDKLITRHSAVLGSTGAGKSTTVASLLRSIAKGTNGDKPGFPSARILLLDIHGEYAQALRDVSEVFRVNPGVGEKALRIPFWALDPAEFLSFAMGKVDDKSLTQILDRILRYKTELVENEKNSATAAASAIGPDTPVKLKGIAEVDLDSLTSDSPLPYSLKKLWYELIDTEIKTWNNQARTEPAIEDAGDAEHLRQPKYSPVAAGSAAPFSNSAGALGIRRQLDQLRSRLLDRQYDFLTRPGEWEPALDGKTEKDLPDLLTDWLGHSKPITVLDLSGVPSTVLVRLIAAILKIIYEGLFWGREKSEGGIHRPQLIVMEEAHRYLSPEIGGAACSMVQRIVKEGRKFGIGAMIVSQRPSEVDETILSQCGTIISLRLSNSSDRAKVQAALPDSLAGIVDSLPILRTGETVIVGEAARLPIRCRITLPSEEYRPNSEDPEVSTNWGRSRIVENYERLVGSWRSQNPRWAQIRPNRVLIIQRENEMERETVQSSNLVSIGYDPESETLEIEFKNGIYQFYNLSNLVYEELMRAPSKGVYFQSEIKNKYPTSKV